jgi:aminoglycoside phosphotransferase (APT) family kinase protein
VENRVERLSYVEGDVPRGGKSPEYLWRDETLEAVARLVRQFHDATIGWQLPPDACWQDLAAFPEGGEVICHNDLAPWNTVFATHGWPTAFVDWDLAAPGSRLWDVAFAIWHFVPLYGEIEAGDPFDPGIFYPRGGRVRRFCDAYGLDSRDGVVEMIKLRQETTHATFKRRAEAGEPAYVRLWEMGAGDGLTRQMAFLDRHRADIEAHLK